VSGADASDTAEIDAEFSRWGNASAAANNADFAVQPAARRGNLLDYTIPADGCPCQVSYVWSPGKVAFYAASLAGSTGRSGQVQPWSQSWECTTSSVPTPGSEAVHMNLWLYRGSAPQSGGGATAAISSFTFTPL
jgi:hypothetical protein